MSDGISPAIALPASPEPVRVSARRLSWFRAAFKDVVDHVEDETGIRYALDDARLVQCFVTWLRNVEQMKRPLREDRRAFFEHAAGMMLSELIEVDPLSVLALPAQADSARPEIFWPEGFCYTVFCLKVAEAAVKQEFAVELPASEEFTRLRTWWSFRENTTDDKGYAIAFFKLFIGAQPNWTMPRSFEPHGGEARLLEAPAPRH